MGRVYGGSLGLLAFALMAIRGPLTGAGTEATLVAASAALFAFAAIGYVVGNVAEHLVNESVRTQFQVAMATWESDQNEKTPAKK
jgi:hypothetical protein